MRFLSNRLWSKISKINNYLLLGILIVFFLFVVVVWDIHVERSVKKERRVNDLELVNNEIHKIGNRHANFLSEISKELGSANINQDREILTIIRRNYSLLNDEGNGWVNLVWESNRDNNKRITQIGVQYVRKETILENARMLSICNKVVKGNFEEVGKICINQSLEHLEHLVEKNAGKKVKVSSNEDKQGYRRVQSKFDKKIYILVQEDTFGNWVRIDKIFFILLCAGICTLIIVKGNFEKRKNRNTNQAIIKDRECKIRCLETFNRWSVEGSIDKNEILVLINYFYLDIKRLGLGVELVVEDRTANEIINASILYKILMSLLLESVSRIYRNGKIMINFRYLEGQYIEMRYTDNLYNIDIADKDDIVKKRLKDQLLYLDKDKIARLIEKNHGRYQEKTILDKRREIIIKMPVLKKQNGGSIINIASLLKKRENNEI